MAIELSADEQLARFGLTEGDVERLVEALGNKNLHVRQVVRAALRGLGEAAAPALYRGLTSEKGTIRKEVRGLLGAIERISCGGRGCSIGEKTVHPKK